MRQKISQNGKPEFVQPEKRPQTISTMHSLGHSIIHEKPQAVGLLDGFEVIESDEMRTVLFVDAALSLGLSYEDAKRAMRHRAMANRSEDETSVKIVARYEAILRKSNWIDYDDQIRLAVQLLNSDERVLAKFSTSASYLLIDEYQDINADQFDLIKLLSGGNPAGLFVVGDDDQSIYNFRGGSPEFIRNFASNFGEKCEILQMKTSRRCPKNILQSANHLVASYDADRLPKHDPEYHMTHEGAVLIHNCPSESREAEIIVTIIRNDMQETTSEKRTAFILVPSRNYVPSIYQQLRKWGIPCHVVREESGSVAKFIFVRKWVENTESNLFARYVIQQIVDGGSSGIPGPMTRGKNFEKRLTHLSKIAALWNEVLADGGSLWQVFQKSARTETVHQDIEEKMKLLKSTYESDLGDFLKNMIESAKAWSSRDQFYEDIRSLAKQDLPAGAGYEVRILTMQKSKGLEAETVFIVGMEDGFMPRSTGESEIAEDARLIFVAMTRAKENLHVMHARKRDGSATFRAGSHALKPSVFVTCLPNQYAKKQYHQSQALAKTKKQSAKAASASRSRS
jgi:DNA helicase-2/ATP-dependent DNA helicase PcrA